jgi:two-component system sensor histidine kinase/response regulator
LIGNAVKFTEEGRIVVQCERQLQGDKECFEFSVQDTGIGITDEARTTLFRPFTQADSSTTRRFGGTGLGLSISKRLIDLMGGQIGVTSSVGSGSRFWFTLPQATPTSGSDGTQSAALKGKRIVVVEPEAGLLAHVGAWLASWGADVVSVSAPAVGYLSGAVLAPPPDAIFVPAALAGLIPTPLFDSTLKLVRLGDEDPQAGRVDDRLLLRSPIRVRNLLKSLCEVEAKVTPSEQPPQSNPCRVLVVDDSPVNLLVARRLLAKLDVRVETAMNGEEALSVLRDSAYDMVLMDCMMPRMDGYEATSALRRGEAGGKNQNTPVIALTANALVTDRQQCLDAGMSDYLSKPLRAGELEQVLERWSTRRHVA